MNTVKRIKIPYIEGLEQLSLAELDLALERSGSKFAVSENNWPAAFPYGPDCNGVIARSQEHLAIAFHVRGLDIRGTELEDNGNTWEDSCCEFFVTHPFDGTYYNFELNCIGTLLAAKRTSRTEKVMFTPDQTAQVKRFTSFPHQAVESSEKVFTWTAALLIPFRLIGIDPAALPVSLRGNFYKCGDRTAHPHYLSWNPIKTPKPDFHRPEFFGELLIH